MVSASVVRDRNSAFCDERLELQAVLSSPLFQRAPNLSKILGYVCEQHFSGKGSDLKEYNIAVDALGRDPGFDPQADAIVRVDLHLLRKRLELFYGKEGRNHRFRIVLPLGQYTPEFVAHNTAEIMSEVSWNCELPGEDLADLNDAARLSESSLTPSAPAVINSEQQIPSSLGRSALQRAEMWARRRAVPLAAVSCCLLGLTIGVKGTLVLERYRIQALWQVPVMQIPSSAANAEILPRISFGTIPDFEDQAIRIRCGSNQDYVDASGVRWGRDRYYAGGTTFRRNATPILRSADSTLYTTGRQGVFHYDVPVPSGAYEVRLLFAETAPGIEDGVREDSFDVGASVSETLDVVSDAGGARTATTKVYSNVRPGMDGKISINFWSSDAFLNAFEIVPEVNGKPSPIRISTLPRVFVDSTGKHWLSDRYFMGGRNRNQLSALNRITSPLFSRERYGSFSYAVPVAKGFSYQLILYMAEQYWSPQNSGAWGIGRRIFSVRCNGLELLHDFDLPKAAQNATVVAVRFQHLQPDSNGKLNLEFVPVTNYAVVNALEVHAE